MTDKTPKTRDHPIDTVQTKLYAVPGGAIVVSVLEYAKGVLAQTDQQQLLAAWKRDFENIGFREVSLHEGKAGKRPMVDFVGEKKGDRPQQFLSRFILAGNRVYQLNLLWLPGKRPASLTKALNSFALTDTAPSGAFWSLVKPTAK